PSRPAPRGPLTTPEPEPEPEPEPVVQPVLVPSCGSPSPAWSTSTQLFDPPLPSPAGTHARITPVPGSVEHSIIWPWVDVFGPPVQAAAARRMRGRTLIKRMPTATATFVPAKTVETSRG